ncbi:aspartate racemase [Aliiruegeria haliotis]|uniref:Aspartate racemase n=1 Tax=Aliiruegeria haliotis TaxID=1280846 RepID=A0A2T0RZ62_9RHOB|nr:aspartate/glutamate racemase family protein [Aliiruegeria haliotis]PRY26465.1 aspartate racemase [Aliiruegeria haliotis]
MHLGLIGGIGPAATLTYYARLVERFRAAGLPLELTIVHADVGALVDNALADRRHEQAEIFARHIRQLQGAGAELASITSIGAHFCFAETEALSPLPLLNAVTPIDTHCAEVGINRIGLLGTEAVMASRLYRQLHQTQAVVPDGDLRDWARAYVDMARAGTCSDTLRKRFFAAGREMVEQQGAEAVLLAGTDLGLAFDGHDPGYPVIDALDIHVAALLAAAIPA